MEMLQNLLEGTYQPLIIRELWKLLILQQQPQGGEQGPGAKNTGGGGGSVTRSGGGKPEVVGTGRRRGSKGSMKWLQKVCGQLLSERLLSKNGVEHVISGIMNMATTGRHYTLRATI